MYKQTKAKIENTIFEATELNGEVKFYRIRPAEGYKLHEKTLDETIIDEETHEETGKKKLGFTTAYVLVGSNYDFDKNDSELYAKPLDYKGIVDVESKESDIEEKAKAYDILMGADE